ncbi:MAG: nucleotidyltransferase family protein [Oscillospiraceae bacterium]|nr:nucleotidyltransferase family protein [Oscillospiraceae bacterium]
MKVSGIICEYNPFHNGHLYHIRETRKNGATHVVAVMSGNFVQRGDTAIIDKIDRARLAVKSGADLIIELPVQYSLSSAENFANGAIWLLKSLGVVEELSFGSECGDVEKLKKALEITDSAAKTHRDEILGIMEKGYTYPRALSSVINGIDSEAAAVISEPNNLLAIEYMRALERFAPAIKPFTVRRTGAAHDGAPVSDAYASASYIRELISSGQYGEGKLSQYTTQIWAQAVSNAVRNGESADISRLERIILYKLRTSSPKELASVSDVGQGFENRLISSRMAGSLDELFVTLKTKRYTMARIRRILLCMLIGITRSDMTHLPPYGRILALNERGKEILALAKGKASIPFATSISKLSQKNPTARRFAELEIRASDIYGLALGTINSAQKDYKAKIMIDLE